jgi:hypothetical protein
MIGLLSLNFFFDLVSSDFSKYFKFNFQFTNCQPINTNCLIKLLKLCPTHRLDDTNPEKEEERYVREIVDMVDWLGYRPHRITHSSDYFGQLYAWARQLVAKGLAYVCHQTVEQMRGFDPPPSPWRDRPVEESLRLLEVCKQLLCN